MKISYVLLSYNDEKTIGRAINSIKFSNIPREEYEIVVVDDGSTDSTPDIVRGCGVELLYTNEGKNTRNQSLGRNLGIRHAKGEYIRFLDGDDYFNPIGLYEDYVALEGHEMYIVNRITLHENSPSAYKRDYSENIFDGVGNYYVSRKHITDNDLYFDEEKFNWHNEDVYFFMRIFDRANEIRMLDSEFSYVCIKRKGSNSDLSEITMEETLSHLDYLGELRSSLRSQIQKKEALELLDKVMNGIIENVLKEVRCER